jgi:hypothetical protein
MSTNRFYHRNSMGSSTSPENLTPNNPIAYHEPVNIDLKSHVPPTYLPSLSHTLKARRNPNITLNFHTIPHNKLRLVTPSQRQNTGPPTHTPNLPKMVGFIRRCPSDGSIHHIENINDPPASVQDPQSEYSMSNSPPTPAPSSGSTSLPPLHLLPTVSDLRLASRVPRRVRVRVRVRFLNLAGFMCHLGDREYAEAARATGTRHNAPVYWFMERGRTMEAQPEAAPVEMELAETAPAATASDLIANGLLHRRPPREVVPAPAPAASEPEVRTTRPRPSASTPAAPPRARAPPAQFPAPAPASRISLVSRPAAAATAAAWAPTPSPFAMAESDFPPLMGASSSGEDGAKKIEAASKDKGNGLAGPWGRKK